MPFHSSTNEKQGAAHGTGKIKCFKLLLQHCGASILFNPHLFIPLNHLKIFFQSNETRVDTLYVCNVFVF